MKRLVIIAVLLVLLGGISFVAWTLMDLPPIRFVLRYGPTPGCEPTGREMTIEGIDFVEIGPGIFRMGSEHLAEGGDWIGKPCAKLGLPWGDQPKPSDELPVRWVEFRRGFWIAKTEVTVAQYRKLKPAHDSLGTTKQLPPRGPEAVTDVSWHDAREYCRWISDRSGFEARLPSEAEWECAARAGSGTEFCFGDDEEDLASYAWFKENSGGRVREVGKKLPNAWDVFDMHGNAWEWCDGVAEGVVLWSIGGPATRSGPSSGEIRYEGHVLRGGGIGSPSIDCRSASRLVISGHDGPVPPEKMLPRAYGFRLAITPKDRRLPALTPSAPPPDTPPGQTIGRPPGEDPP